MSARCGHAGRMNAFGRGSCPSCQITAKARCGISVGAVGMWHRTQLLSGLSACRRVAVARPEVVYRQVYVQRGAVPEQPIGQMKNGLRCDRLSSCGSCANALRNRT